ncbi:MAG: hypothetical protein KBD01_16865 [Acidobacteria bacterium]|nr:hypothetical protein [Acidobacteriota bacterium]
MGRAFSLLLLGLLAAIAGPTPACAGDATLVVAIAVDRDGAALAGFTAKARPYRGDPDPEPARALEADRPVQLEIALVANGGETFVRRIDLPGLCLEHGPADPPHVAGDTIRVHHDSFVVELPALDEASRIEVAAYRAGAAGPARFVLADLALDPSKFVETERPLVPGEATTLGSVHWPEEYGETERYKIWGSADEVATRVNVVLVPDGYTHAQKSLMEQHAQAVVDAFRQKTPFKEHEPFFNYTLVYAYSNQDGTDQCDCSVLRDTAMNTRFPKQVPTCGDSANRCLYYGWGCDPKNYTDANITAAELRAPAKDVTLVMVNTARYGGCGGPRAVYAAGNGSAAEIAIHELGHSLAGLADEYTSYSTCGTSADEINTSLNAIDGAWPEWVPELGAPREGAQYYAQCIYRPVWDCEMRSLGVAFCPVCNQRWSLRTYGHWRVSPTAPISASSPAPEVTTQVGLPVSFSVATRLSLAPATHAITWTRQGPSDPAPVTVATNVPQYSGAFAQPGDHVVGCEVVADTNFVKPSRTGANRDVVAWTVHATPIPEVSAAAGPPMTVVRRADGRLDLAFADVGALHYNLYVSRAAGTHSFEVGAPDRGKVDCDVATMGAGGVRMVQDYDADAGLAGDPSLLFLLVTADNGPATETTLGADSAGLERTATASCAR